MMTRGWKSLGSATCTPAKEVMAAAAAGGAEEWEIDSSKILVKQFIAKGSYGAVHIGSYEGKPIAVKLLDWGEDDREPKTILLRAAFWREVSTWYKLDHPNVSKLIGATKGTVALRSEKQDGKLDLLSNLCCLVSEYQSGGTLYNFLRKNRETKLHFKTVIKFSLDLARGLSYLHSKKVVHRDIKTDNVLLDKNQNLKIIDFGVARFEAFEYEMTGFTGTLGYMAPEVILSKPYTKKCDVYSFGICLWEIYCSDIPFPKMTFEELTTAVVYKDLRPKIPKCCPSSFAKVMKLCWDPNPYSRPEMEQVVAMLEAIDISKGRGMKPLHHKPRPWDCFCGN